MKLFLLLCFCVIVSSTCSSDSSSVENEDDQKPKNAIVGRQGTYSLNSNNLRNENSNLQDSKNYNVLDTNLLREGTSNNLNLLNSENRKQYKNNLLSNSMLNIRREGKSDNNLLHYDKNDLLRSNNLLREGNSKSLNLRNYENNNLLPNYLNNVAREGKLHLAETEAHQPYRNPRPREDSYKSTGWHHPVNRGESTNLPTDIASSDQNAHMFRNSRHRGNPGYPVGSATRTGSTNLPPVQPTIVAVPDETLNTNMTDSRFGYPGYGGYGGGGFGGGAGAGAMAGAGASAGISAGIGLSASLGGHIGAGAGAAAGGYGYGYGGGYGGGGYGFPGYG